MEVCRTMITPTPLRPIHILLADDDRDDRDLFHAELKALSFHTQLATVEDGEKLMYYLTEHREDLPDILFLDNNMPCKNGAECLLEIKANPKLNALPVIIYSTYIHEDIADDFFKAGAHFFVRKTDLKELIKVLTHILTLFTEDRFSRPTRKNFVLQAATL